jgi:hypothetical protein
MIRIEIEVIKRIGQAKMNKIRGIVNWIDNIDDIQARFTILKKWFSQWMLNMM